MSVAFYMRQRPSVWHGSNVGVGTMRVVALGVMALFFLLLSGAFGLIAFVAVAAGGAGTASAAATVSNPSDEALSDIPPVLLELFITEAQQCPGLPWQVMAGISKVESDHGRFGGSTIEADGVVRPHVIGVALDGGDGTARIGDTDDGMWDGDVVWDRAVGPFQFIPSSWRIFGIDANEDGVGDPHNVFDAVAAMRRHLCPDGQIVDIAGAVFAYNRSDAYVAAVLDWARRYTGPLAFAALPIAGYALPISPGLLTEAMLVRPHHTYPAWDAAVPVGTPVFAIVAGTVTSAVRAGVFPADPNRCGNTVAIAGIDGVTYTYCHLSVFAVETEQVVGAGTLIGLSGGAPGAPGAGNTTGPHLHLSVHVSGVSVCPQPLLLTIAAGTPVSPAIAPLGGCVAGRATTDWQQWLHQLALEQVPAGEHG